MNRALFALFLASFGIGTTEFVPIGLLPNIATDLHVSLSQAGLLISIYALGVTIGSPLLALTTTRFSRHAAMLLLISLFISGNFLSSLAPNFSLLIGARLLTSLCHGAFFGLGAVVAANVVPLHRKAQAISIMFAGLTVANIFGVPIDTAVGQWLGWRAAFGLITCIGLFSALALYLWIPRKLPLQNQSIVLEFSALFRSQVLLTLVISVLTSTSLFCVLTYITPLLEDLTQVSPHFITGFLMLFGVGITIGNLIGGKLADWHLMPSLLITLCLLALTLALFTLTIYNVYAAALTILMWGILAFALIPPLQMRVVQQAVGAPNLASTINQAAFHLGNSSGAFISSMMVSYSTANTQLMWVGAGVALMAFGVTFFTYKTDDEVSLIEVAG